MKIRPSLKLYFFISVVMLGSVMALGFSLLSVNYFVDDFAIKEQALGALT